MPNNDPERRVHTFEVEIAQYVDESDPSIDENDVLEAITQRFWTDNNDQVVGAINVRKTSEDK